MNDPHGNSPLRNAHSPPNGVFMHELYGPVPHYGRERRTCLTD